MGLGLGGFSIGSGQGSSGSAGNPMLRHGGGRPMGGFAAPQGTAGTGQTPGWASGGGRRSGYGGGGGYYGASPMNAGMGIVPPWVTGLFGSGGSGQGGGTSGGTGATTQTTYTPPELIGNARPDGLETFGGSTSNYASANSGKSLQDYLNGETKDFLGQMNRYYYDQAIKEFDNRIQEQTEPGSQYGYTDFGHPPPNNTQNWSNTSGAGFMGEYDPNISYERYYNRARMTPEQQRYTDIQNRQDHVNYLNSLSDGGA